MSYPQVSLQCTQDLPSGESPMYPGHTHGLLVSAASLQSTQDLPTRESPIYAGPTHRLVSNLTMTYPQVSLKSTCDFPQASLHFTQDVPTGESPLYPGRTHRRVSTLPVTYPRSPGGCGESPIYP